MALIHANSADYFDPDQEFIGPTEKIAILQNGKYFISIFINIFFCNFPINKEALKVPVINRKRTHINS
jgi:hypothetical protein